MDNVHLNAARRAIRVDVCAACTKALASALLLLLLLLLHFLSHALFLLQHGYWPSPAPSQQPWDIRH